MSFVALQSSFFLPHLLTSAFFVENQRTLFAPKNECDQKGDYNFMGVRVGRKNKTLLEAEDVLCVKKRVR